MNKVFVTPGGGYGNRFPLICSGMRIADLTGRNLYVNWMPQEEMPVLLSDLFGNDLPFLIGAAPSYVHPLGRDESHALVRPPRVPQTPAETDVNLWGFDYYAYDLDQRSLSGEPRDPFMREVGKHFNRLPLALDVQERLAEFQNRLDFESTLGVHLRRGAKNSIYTEMDRSRDWWTVEAYVRSIEIILEMNTNIKTIYVSTNSDSVREYMIKRFGTMAATNELAGTGWHDLAALKEALVEMVVLSKCATILRQAGTSFSWFASVINLAPVVTMTNFDGSTNEPVLDWWDWSEKL